MAIAIHMCYGILQLQINFCMF